MKYDDASWHYGGTFPSNSPQEYGGTHIALFLKWCFTKGWAGDLHLQEEPEDTRKVINGTMPANEFLFKYCDGKLTNEDFNSAGNAFAEKYYGDDGLYLHDYSKQFKDLMYIAPESAHDFNKYAAMMDSRLQSRILTKSQTTKPPKPWWRFW